MAKRTSFGGDLFPFGANAGPNAAAFRTAANRPYWRGDRIRGGAAESFRRGATGGKKSGKGGGS